MLYQVCRELIPRDSPVASIGDEELQFFHTFFEHIDTERAFCGLRPVSDGNATLWTSSKGSKILQSEAEKESDIDIMYKVLESDQRNADIADKLTRKEKKIAELESVLNTLEEELGSEKHDEDTKDVVETNPNEDDLHKKETDESRVDDTSGTHGLNESERDGAAVENDDVNLPSSYDQNTFSSEGFGMTTDSDESSSDGDYTSDSDATEDLPNREVKQQSFKTNHFDHEAEYQVVE